MASDLDESAVDDRGVERNGVHEKQRGRGRMIVIAMAISLVIGWAVSGELLYHSMIGLDPSFFPAGEWLQRNLAPSITMAIGGIVIAVLVLLAIAVVGFIVGRRTTRRPLASSRSVAAPTSVAPSRPVAPSPHSATLPPGESRRNFLAGAVVGASAFSAGLAGALGHTFLGIGKSGSGWLGVQEEINSNEGIVKTHPTWDDAWKGARVQSYGRLGRTGWAISDTVLGAGRLRADDWKLVRAALDRGINYIDTAPDYSVEGSELAVGRALENYPRDQVFLATKFCTPIGHLPAGTSVARYKEVIHDSLRRLGTDYVDLVHIHSCDEVGRLMDPNVHEAFDQLRVEGEARFLGVSTHTPRLVDVANQAIDSGRFDVMMLAYHHGIWPQLDQIIDRAHEEQDMGIVAMKTRKGAKHRNLAGFHDANTYAQAALKWVHSNAAVSCAVISFFEQQHLDEYLYASGRRLTNEDAAVLERYDQSIVGSYCAPHCGVCLESCPEEVPIHDVLRHRMYFEDYHDERIAMQLYSKLEVNASACVGCSAPCLGRCPLGIPIPDRTRGAHELLSFPA